MWFLWVSLTLPSLSSLSALLISISFCYLRVWKGNWWSDPKEHGSHSCLNHLASWTQVQPLRMPGTTHCQKRDTATSLGQLRFCNLASNICLKSVKCHLHTQLRDLFTRSLIPYAKLFHCFSDFWIPSNYLCFHTHVIPREGWSREGIRKMRSVNLRFAWYKMRMWKEPVSGSSSINGHSYVSGRFFMVSLSTVGNVGLSLSGLPGQTVELLSETSGVLILFFIYFTPMKPSGLWILD